MDIFNGIEHTIKDAVEKIILLLDSCVFWDALSAIGTILASIIALWLGLRDTRKKLDCVLVWDGTTKSQPMLVINNPSKKMIVLKEITIKYKKDTVIHLILSEEYQLLIKTALSPNEVQTVSLPHLEKFKLEKMESRKSMRLNTLCIELKDISGKKYTSKQRISDDELYSLIIGQSMLSD